MAGWLAGGRAGWLVENGGGGGLPVQVLYETTVDGCVGGLYWGIGIGILGLGNRTDMAWEVKRPFYLATTIYVSGM